MPVFRLICLGIVASTLACAPKKPLPIPVGSDSCERAASRIQDLACTRSRDGGPLWLTPAGTPFATACRDAAADGRDWHPDCVAAATSCDSVQLVFRKGCGK